jgi:hypothetical protein
MRGRGGALYWVATGAVMGFGLISLMTIGFPFVVVGLVMALVGVWRPGLSGGWGFLAGFGGFPALVFLSHIVAGLRTVLNPYCDQRSPGTTIPPPSGPVECAFIPSSYYVMFVIFTALALVGVALGLFLRAHSRPSAA